MVKAARFPQRLIKATLQAGRSAMDAERVLSYVIPAKAGISLESKYCFNWKEIPAFAGMTMNKW